MQNFDLPASCDRGIVADLVAPLRSALEGGPVTIDGRAVTRFGQQLLQLLAAAALTARAAATTLTVTPSDALAEGIQLAGLGELIIGDDAR